MTWAVLGAVVALLLLATVALKHRRAELRAMADTVAQIADAKARGSHQARLQYPHIDLSQCIGCGTCVAACPEDGVLALVHGQAAVVHGARCVGHGLCAQECPVGAIAVTLGDISSRRDLPALSEELEVNGTPGLFLAGEVTGYALIRTAIGHGSAVADEVAKRCAARRDRRSPARRAPEPELAAVGAGRVAAVAAGGESDGAGAGAEGHHPPAAEPLDLCVVGAGPAGIACSLAAKAHGLRSVTLEQEEFGGTVAKYPRRKLVMTQPVELPLYGKLGRTSYRKEELMELWERIAKQHALPVRTGQEFVGLERDDDGVFTVRTRTAKVRARHVCLCLGRRGTPRKLDVPGEELPKVTYSLLDAQSYRGRKILVVGGGDSAVEAALGLSEQPGNQVTLSYRKHAFFRLKSRNEVRLADAVEHGQLEVVYQSQVTGITERDVALRVDGADGASVERTLPNDEVFVFAGGVPPFKLLESTGVSFDPADRPAASPIGEQGTGLLRALAVGLVLALCTLLWAVGFSGYYALPAHERPDSALHGWLKPSSPLGICLGAMSCVLILANLAYLLRRCRLGQWLAGTLQNWLAYHIVTGILAMLLALVHAGMDPRNTSGGHAFAALVVLVATGAIGRYLYSYVPKAANGRELVLDEVKSRLAAISGEWDVEGRGFGEQVRAEVQELATRGSWQHSFVRRVRALFGSRARLGAALARLRQEGLREGIPDEQLKRILHLARRAHRMALMAAHYEDVRGVLGSWRYFHRWVAVVMVALVVVHVATAVRYAGVF